MKRTENPRLLRLLHSKLQKSSGMVYVHHDSKPASALTKAPPVSPGLAFFGWPPTCLSGLSVSAAIWFQGERLNKAVNGLNDKASDFNRVASHFTYGILAILTVHVAGPYIRFFTLAKESCLEIHKQSQSQLQEC
jgi:hypothetical protein